MGITMYFQNAGHLGGPAYLFAGTSLQVSHSVEKGLLAALWMWRESNPHLPFGLSVVIKYSPSSLQTMCRLQGPPVTPCLVS